MSKPTVLILTAGASSRFFPFNQQHKGYLRLFGKSLISQTIANLLDHDFTDLVVVVGESDPAGEQLQKILHDDGITAPIKMVTQPHPTGATGAVLAAREHISGPIVITSPYYTKSGSWADELWSIYQETEAQGVLLASEVETPALYGILQTEGDRVVSVVEKPAPGTEPSNLRARSIYLFHQDLVQYLDQQPDVDYSFEAGYTAMAKDNFITYKQTTDVDITLKFPWHLLDLKDILLSQHQTQIAESAEIAATAVLDDTAGAIVIEPEAAIRDFSKIVGPCFIGRGSLVGEYSFIRHSSIEPGVQVGANSEVVRSIVLQGATLHSCYIADSIIGEKVKVGAGLITANKRFDNQTVQVPVKNSKVDSFKAKLGVLVGNDSQLGIGVRTMPGTVIAPESTIKPTASLHGFVDSSDNS